MVAKQEKERDDTKNKKKRPKHPSSKKNRKKSRFGPRAASTSPDHWM
jgi:hypothetical protein